MKVEFKEITQGCRALGHQCQETERSFRNLTEKVHDIMNVIASKHVLRKMMGEE